MNKTNLSTNIAKVSAILQVVASKARLEILLAIGTEELCVCHLEDILGYRQAYISQQMMALREAGLLDSRRAGKYIFYRLAKPEILGVFQNAAKIAGVDLVMLDQARREKQCFRPDCVPAISNPRLVEHTH
jgi:DNA-binding transcriptional ArsR family regulator